MNQANRQKQRSLSGNIVVNREYQECHITGQANKLVTRASYLRALDFSLRIGKSDPSSLLWAGRSMPMELNDSV